MLDRTFISSLESGRKLPTLITIFQLRCMFSQHQALFMTLCAVEVSNMSVRQSLKFQMKTNISVWGCVVDKKLSYVSQVRRKETICWLMTRPATEVV
jgi:hypothetical protein